MRGNQHPKASGKDLRSTLYKKGRNSPDDSFDDIAENLISYFKEFSLFEEYEKEIVKKYNIKKEHDDCWPADDIKRAWGKTQRMKETSKRRKCWSLAVMVQMMKRCLSYDESERLSDPHEVSALPACGETRNERRGPPADRDSQQNTNIVEQTHIDNDGPVYIRVPFSEMFGHQSSLSSETDPMENLDVFYKLKDKVPSFTEIKKKTSFVMLYDNQTRNAAWVYELLNKSIVEENKKNKHLKRSSFKVDKSIHEPFQTPEGKNPYKDPFERGHLAPARDHRSSQRALDDTSLLSNISPQCSTLNHGIWKRLENLCVEIAEEEEERNVHVYTGPLYVPAGKGKVVKYKFEGGKVVPTHFFKVIIVEEEDGTVLQPTCYKIPNVELQNKDKLTEFEVDIKDIERESGLIFTDRRCEEGMIDRILTVTQKKVKGNKNPDPQKLPKKKLKCVKKGSKTKLQNKDELAKSEIRVRISTALSDPAGF